MIDLSIKRMFFDRAAVQKRADPAKRKVLSKAGAFIRTGAKSSIRKRKGISKPGAPPHSHTDLLRKLILFGYDPGSASVVAGPAKIKSGQAPRALELGGQSRAAGYRRGAKRERAIRVRPRPFMGPAMQRELPKFPELWRNSIRPH